MPKLQPAVQILNFRMTGDATTGWIDLSQAVSIVNRRFYRQGLQWAVSSISLQQQTSAPNYEPSPGALRTEILPQSWVMSNAWHKTFALWRKQQSEALEASGAESVRAKFNDFKIMMDTAHVTDFIGQGSDLNATNLIPRIATTEFDTGEWDASQIVIPNATADASGSEVDPAEFYLHAVGLGGATHSKGIIAGYSYSRAVPFSPDPEVVPNTSLPANWMRNMFDVGNDDSEVLANASLRNNDLPYDQDAYPHDGFNAPGLQLLSEHFINPNSINSRVTIPGTVVPCGLIKVTNETGVILDIQVHLMPGKHRGYMAEPMQDM